MTMFQVFPIIGDPARTGPLFHQNWTLGTVKIFPMYYCVYNWSGLAMLDPGPNLLKWK